MAKSANKHQIFSLIEVIFALLHVREKVCRDCLHLSLRCNLVDCLFFDIGRIICHVSSENQIQLLLLPVCRGLQQCCISGQLILAFFTEKMQIVSIINDTRIREFTDCIDVLHRNMRPVEKYIANVLAVFFQPVLPVLCIIRSIEHFNAHLLQRIRIRLMCKEIITDEFYAESLIDKQLQILIHRTTASILIVMRYVMINHQQNFLMYRTFTCAERINRIRQMIFLKFPLPFFKELFLIRHLICLLTARSVCTVRNTLKVNDNRFRLIHDFTAMLANLER